MASKEDVENVATCMFLAGLVIVPLSIAAIWTWAWAALFLGCVLLAMGFCAMRGASR